MKMTRFLKVMVVVSIVAYSNMFMVQGIARAESYIGTPEDNEPAIPFLSYVPGITSYRVHNTDDGSSCKGSIAGDVVNLGFLATLAGALQGFKVGAYRGGQGLVNTKYIIGGGAIAAALYVGIAAFFWSRVSGAGTLSDNYLDHPESFAKLTPEQRKSWLDRNPELRIALESYIKTQGICADSASYSEASKEANQTVKDVSKEALNYTPAQLINYTPAASQVVGS